VTDLATVIVTVHELVPEHPLPLQPTNADPSAGAAVRVTIVP
jgi:hypothetical protein